MRFNTAECEYFNWGYNRGYVPQCLTNLDDDTDFVFDSEDIDEISEYLFEDDQGFSCASQEVLDKVMDLVYRDH